MGLITIAQPYISRSDINEAIEAFKQVRLDDSPLMRIRAGVEIKKIDVLFVSYLLLFKAECPELTIILEFPKGINTDAKFKLSQLGVYGYLLTGKSVFSVKIAQDPEEFFDYSKQKSFPRSYFVLSDRFILSLLISENYPDLFRFLLETPLRKLVGKPLYEPIRDVSWQESNPELYTQYNTALVTGANPQDRQQCIISLAGIAFYKCLAEVKVLNFYTDQEFRADKTKRRPHISAGVMGTKQSYEYYALVEPVFNELADRPLIYQFVFSALISSELIPGRTPDDISIENANKIWHLWQFTENLVKSLHELAKNIRDHVKGGSGFISCSIFNDETELVDIKTLLNEIISKDAAAGKKTGTYLDIHVADLGGKGLIPTLIERSESLLEIFRENDIVRELIEEDIGKLRRNEVGLKHLFDANNTSHLNQQCKRAMAHIGLLTLSKLIETNDGILKVDTQENDEKRNTILVSKAGYKAESEIKHGTFFTIILPLHPSKTYKTYLPGGLQQPSEPSPHELKGIENLSDFDYVRINTGEPPETIQKKTVLGYIFPVAEVKDRTHEYALWKDCSAQVDKWLVPAAGADRCLVHLDLENLVINASTLLRLVGFWEMYYPRITLLLSNITNTLYEDLTAINHALTANNESLGFWNEQSPLLIYSFVPGEEQGDRFYFTDIFLGKKFDDFHFYNKLIQRNHFNSTRLPKPAKKLAPVNGTEYAISSAAFYNNKVLLPFDLVLKSGSGISLFECNATMLLKNDIDTGKKTRPDIENMPALTGTLGLVKKFAGYKVSESHYRIGSKLHISEFYYAKRIFQNNFFASRFAFILSGLIVDALRQKSTVELQEIRKKGLTIVGYGLYSELLLSLVEKFVRNSKILPAAQVNHNLITDESETSLVKSTPVRQLVIIIVPIASTFSTAIKIEERLLRDKPYTILPPHYNILHVSGKPGCPEQEQIEKEFKWVSKDLVNKTIHITAYFDEQEAVKVQRYLIRLLTTWRKIENCCDCFPYNDKNGEELLKEKPVFETDRTSVTPAIIFDYPKGTPAPDRQFILTSSMIRFGQYAVSNSHFIYSIDTEIFLQKNLGRVKTWLKEISTDTQFSERFPNHHHTLIVSSCHYSNAAFIDLINEELFSSSANIIHYDPENDFIQNFELVYGNEIALAERIIFVDDTLKSGETFSQINEFVRYILAGKKKKEKGIDACIVLIDKSEPFTRQTIREKMTGIKTIYGFANLQLYTALSLSNTSTMQLEKERYLKLIQDSFLDSIKVYFYKHIKKFKYNKNGGFEDETENILQLRRNNHLLMIEATHMVYQYFARNEHSLADKMSLAGFLDGIGSIRSPLIKPELAQKQMLNLYPLEVYIIKALTQYPFTQYEPLRRWVFEWVLQLLDGLLDTIAGEIDKGKFTVESFSGLKFMIRRSTQMNSNYMISKKFFGFMKKLYSDGGLPKIRQQLKAEIDQNSDRTDIFGAMNRKKYAEIISFPIFVSAQIKELLSKNPFRGIRLEPFLVFDRDVNDPGYKQLILILRGENSMAFQKFYESISAEKKWKNNYADKKPDPTVTEPGHTKALPESDAKPIGRELRENYIQSHPAHRAIAQLMTATEQEAPADNLALRQYLWIRNFIEADQRVPKVPLTERADKLFAMLRQVFGFHGLDFAGIFLAIPDGEHNSHLVYDKNSGGAAELDSNNFPGAENQYIQRFLNGILPDEADYFTTMVELRRNRQDGFWIDLYEVQKDNVIPDLSYSFLSEKEITNMLLLRLSKRTDEKTEKTLGVIGIYFQSKKTITGAKTVRYPLLLKSALSDFVERHYHNTEFSDWLYAENTKRLALLSGHGKEMLKSLIEKDEKRKHYKTYREIAWNLEHLQVIILLHDHVKNSEPLEDITNTFNKFYHVEGSKIINKEYFTTVESMAEEMYALEEIEVFVDCDVRIPCDDDFSFAFNRSILNLIIFELVVNAKKNRWHFLEDDVFSKYDKNIFHGSVTEVEDNGRRCMQVKLTNIGPEVSDTVLSALKSPARNVKPNDITAGTSLLKTLVHKILKGKIDFDSNPVHPTTGLQEFTVTLTLPEMN